MMDEVLEYNGEVIDLSGEAVPFYGMMYEDGTEAGFAGEEAKSYAEEAEVPLLARPVFIGATAGAALLVGVALGFLLAKRKIKKGCESNEI